MQQPPLANVLTGILLRKRNKKTFNKFVDATIGLKPANCNVKIGWVSGKSITFDCLFEKGGSSEDIFAAVESGVEKPDEIVHFILGLNPKIFYFNTHAAIDELKPNHFFLAFKLLRNEKDK